MRPAPAPSIPPAALKAAGARRLLAAGALASAAGVFAHCILPLP
ncbi:hypothetical protein PVT71_15175 [Salipiger sp. H15]|uniref:Uncharacterized protein n=1 Tax=Alloyangia sp. H15 TaxID=3029062 RepID=A0AAU8AMP9_9RHOB